MYDSVSYTLSTSVKISAKADQNICPVIFHCVKISALKKLQTIKYNLNEAITCNVFNNRFRYNQYLVIGSVSVSFVLVFYPWFDAIGTRHDLIKDHFIITIFTHDIATYIFNPNVQTCLKATITISKISEKHSIACN